MVFCFFLFSAGSEQFLSQMLTVTEFLLQSHLGFIDFFLLKCEGKQKFREQR